MALCGARQGVPRCPVFGRATLRRLPVFSGQALLAARRGSAVLEGNVHVRVDVNLLAVLEAGERAVGGGLEEFAQAAHERTVAE